MDRERGVFLAVFRAMVCNGKKRPSRGSHDFLVVEPDRFIAVVDLCVTPDRFRLYFCLSLSVDSVFEKFDNPLSL